MKRNLFALAFGAAVIGTAALAACSGGGSSNTSAPLPVTLATNAAGSSSTTSTGTRVTLTYSAKALASKHAHKGLATNRRTPKWIHPYGSVGIQIAVSAAGAPTQTIYADISYDPNPGTPSPLCTEASNDIVTCTLNIPTVGASETINATEVDSTPSGENMSTGYGTGFPSGTDVYAVGTATTTITGGSNTISLALNPVLSGGVYIDCLIVSPTNYTQPSSAGIDYSTQRVTVTAGLAQTVYLADCLEDYGYYSINTLTPQSLPFVDLNGTPVPATVSVTGSGAQIALEPVPAPSATFAPASGLTYGSTVTLANESVLGNNGYDYDCVFIAMKLDGTLVPPNTATVTGAANLTAKAPAPEPTWFDTSYVPPSPQPYTIVPVSAAPLTPTVAVSATTVVTGTDAGAGTNGMQLAGASSASTCTDIANPAQTDATFTSGTYNSGTGTQAFTITGTTAGTCSLVMTDGYTGTQAPPITLTVTP